jgi:exopolyphosphatase/guanosine-5'-triphosphate,3'-diphosphate pyrophosphatase
MAGMEICVLDLGASSFHLLHAKVAADGGVTRIGSYREPIRFGLRTLASGVIDDVAWMAGLDAIGRLAAQARALRPDRFVTIATSVVREAINGDVFVRAARRLRAIDIEVLSTEQEAALAYRGARSELPDSGRIAVVDVGGGSIELAVGDGADCTVVGSLPLGVVRLRDAFADGGGFGPADRAALAWLLRLTTAPAVRAVRRLSPERVVFASGTARAVRDLLETSMPGRAASADLPVDALHQLAEIAAGLDRDALIARGVAAARADTIAIGATVLEVIASSLGVRASVASRGLREGVALREHERALGEPPARRVDPAQADAAAGRQPALEAIP